MLNANQPAAIFGFLETVAQLALLVTFENAADTEKLRVTTDSTKQLSIALQPDEEKKLNAVCVKSLQSANTP
jgi:hypothetical protein